MSAYLLLEDGTRFAGEGAGVPGAALGEVVFGTSMTGYQESLTDPSFAHQILVFTAPMIGNYGIEPDVSESTRIQVRGVVCREARNATPNGRTGFVEWLTSGAIPLLHGIDTRAVVRHIRQRGAMRGALVTDRTPAAAAAERIQQEPLMSGLDLASTVAGPARRMAAAGAPRARVTVIDYGAKQSILRLLAEAGADVTVLGHDATPADVDATNPDGVLLANGPGDPGVMDTAVGAIRGMLAADRPLLGICLGHQLLARALGLETFKLRFGHRGANHPVLELDTGRVLVTSQNHGFAVAPPDTDADVVVTHTSLYDKTVEGVRVRTRPVWSLQFHPEAAPGPHDARAALDEFVTAAAAHAARNAGAA